MASLLMLANSLSFNIYQQLFLRQGAKKSLL